MTEQPQELTPDQAQLFHTVMLHLVEGVLKQAAIAVAELDVSIEEADGDVLVASQNLIEIIDRIMPELSDAVEAALNTIPGVISTHDAESILDMITGSISPSDNGNGEILH